MSALKPDVDSTHDLGTTTKRWRNLFVDGITVTDDITIAGNLTVEGTQTVFETNNIIVKDPLFKLAKDNSTSDALDIGFYGLYDTSGSQDLYAGLFRDTDDDKFHLFKSLQVEPTTIVDKTGTGYTAATLVVGHLEPGTAGSGGLGSASAEWSDLFLTTGGSVKFGAGQSVTLTHIDDTGLRLNGTKQLQFQDDGTHISSPADGRIEVSSDGTGANAISLAASAGGVDIDAAATKDVSIEGGQVALASKDNAASAISLTTNVGVAETIVVTNTLGQTENSAADLNAAAIQLKATAGGIGLTWNDSKDLWAEGGRAVITANQDEAAAIKLHADAGTSQTIVLQNDAGTTDGADGAGSILLAADAGGIGLAWNDAKDLWAEGGKAIVTANEDDAAAIKLHASAGTNQTIQLLNTQGTSSAAIDIQSVAGGFSVDGVQASNVSVASADDGDDLTISVTGDTDSSLVLSSAGTSDTDSQEALQVTASAGGMTLKSAKAMSLKTTAGNTGIGITPNGSGTLTLGADTNTKVDINALTVELDAGSKIVMDAASTDQDAITINSAGGIDITAAGDNGKINISATEASDFTLTADAAEEDLTIKLSAGAGIDSSLVLESQGSGSDALIIKTTRGGVDIDSTGSLELNSSSTIDIGNDDVDTNITLGSDGVRTILIGTSSGTVSTAPSTKVQLDALNIDLNAGTSGVNIDAAGASNLTTSAGALTITSDDTCTWSSSDVLNVSGTNGLNLQEGGSTRIAINNDGTIDATSTLSLGTAAGSGQDLYLYTAGTAAHVGVQWDADGETEGVLLGGADDHGVDLKFFGETSGRYMHWDMSNDALVLGGATKLAFNDFDQEHISADASGVLTLNAENKLALTSDIIDLSTPSLIVQSGTASKPVVEIKHTGDDQTGGELKFLSTQGGTAGVANDVAGSLTFYSNNDAAGTPESIKYGQIKTIASSITDGSETGTLSLGVHVSGGENAGSYQDIITIAGGETAAKSTVTIAGNLQVDGDTVTVNVSTMEVEDKAILVAKGAANDAAADGAGITVDSGEGDKTLHFAATGDNFTSSENFDIANGKVYKINNTSVLTADGAAKVQSDVAGVGLSHDDGVLALDISEIAAGDVASGDKFLMLDSNGSTEQLESVDDIATLFAGTGLSAASAVMSVDLNQVSAADVAVANDSIVIIDANDSNGTRKESISDLMTAISGDGIQASSGVLSLDLKANSGLVIDTTELKVDLGASAIHGTLAIGDGGTGQTELDDMVNGTNGGLSITNGTGTIVGGDATFALDLNDLSAAAGGVAVANDSIAIIDASATNATKKQTISGLITSVAGEGLAATDGVLSLDFNEVTEAAINVASDSIMFLDSDGTASRRDTVADLITAVAGEGLAATDGVLSLNFNEVTEAAVNVANDSILFLDSDGTASRRDTVADLVTGITGTGLSASSGVISIPTNGVVTAMITDANVTNAKLENSSITFSAVGSANEAIALGQTVNFGGTDNEVDVAYDASINKFSFGLPNSVIITQNLDIGGDLEVTGDITAAGLTASGANITFADNLIEFGESNLSQEDIGFFGQRGTGIAANGFAGLAFDEGDDAFKAFTSSGKPSADISAAAGFALADLSVKAFSATGSVSGDLRTTTDVPANASASGTAGDIAVDENYIYICVDTDTWKRVAIATW